MARADLILELVRYSTSGNKMMLRKAIESIIAEERGKQHTVLADKLEQELNRSSQSTQSTTSSIMAMGTKAENYVVEVNPSKQMSSLILPKDVVESCNELIQEQYRVDLLRSYGLEPRHRILMTGAPGTGKTSLAEALANELMVPLYVVRYDSLVGSYLGETASRLRQLFDFARSRHCILFFDEFETLGKERGDDHETGEIKRVVSSLLLQIDALPSYVIVIGATNHPELLDRAVWRRFQLRIELPMPSKSDIVMWLEKFQLVHDIKFGMSSETIANKLVGANYADIEEFGFSILRKYVLSLPSDNVKGIVSQELKMWSMKKNNNISTNIGV